MSAEFGYTPAVAISHQERDAYLQFARLAVRAAGEVILPYFRSGVQVTNNSLKLSFDIFQSFFIYAKSNSEELFKNFHIIGIFVQIPNAIKQIQIVVGEGGF